MKSFKIQNHHYIIPYFCFSNSIRLLQDTRERDIGTPRGFGVDEDMGLVITDLYTQPVGTVNTFSFLFYSKDLIVFALLEYIYLYRLLVQVEECFLLM